MGRNRVFLAPHLFNNGSLGGNKGVLVQLYTLGFWMALGGEGAGLHARLAFQYS
jgi:hypothetical protein